MTEKGYGVITDSTMEFKIEANHILVREFVMKTKNLKQEYLDCCKANEMDPDDRESEDIFVFNYENDLYHWDGIEGLLVDVINEMECNGEGIFRYEDYAIYVAATIPANATERAKMLTLEQIRTILAEHINPLIKEPVTIQWLDINLD